MFWFTFFKTLGTKGTMQSKKDAKTGNGFMSIKHKLT